MAADTCSTYQMHTGPSRISSSSPAQPQHSPRMPPQQWQVGQQYYPPPASPQSPLGTCTEAPQSTTITKTLCLPDTSPRDQVSPHPLSSTPAEDLIKHDVYMHAAVANQEQESEDLHPHYADVVASHRVCVPAIPALSKNVPRDHGQLEHRVDQDQCLALGPLGSAIWAPDFPQHHWRFICSQN